MRPYSKDLRLKVLAAVDRAMPKKEVVQIFGVSEPTIGRYLKLRRETGGTEPKPVLGSDARKRRALEERLPAQVRLNPDLTLEEHCELFEEESDMEVSNATMSRALKRLRLTLKKSRSRLPSRTRSRECSLAKSSAEDRPGSPNDGTDYASVP